MSTRKQIFLEISFTRHTTALSSESAQLRNSSIATPYSSCINVTALLCVLKLNVCGYLCRVLLRWSDENFWHVTVMSWTWRKEIFVRPVTHHRGWHIERNSTVDLARMSLSNITHIFAPCKTRPITKLNRSKWSIQSRERQYSRFMDWVPQAGSVRWRFCFQEIFGD